MRVFSADKLISVPYEDTTFEISKDVDGNWNLWAIPEADLMAQMEEWKRNILQTVLLVTAATLRDEFDFGAKRMSRFIKRFNEKSDCLAEDYLTWNDMAIDMAAEVGIDFELPYFAKEKGEKTA